jgi:DNA polymerase (family 10)
MDNYQIADSFSFLAKLMEIHNENSFKARSYSIAAFTIEKLTVQLSNIEAEKIFAIKGIGESTGKKVIELLMTGELKVLNEIIEKTPPGIIEMLNVKGIGPKKIATIWKEMEIENIGELLYACKENSLKLFKGFGEKTQQNVIDTIEFYLKSKGSFLYSQVEAMYEGVESFFMKLFDEHKVAFTGAYKRQLEIINELDFVIDEKMAVIEKKLSPLEDLELVEKNQHDCLYRTSVGLKFRVYACDSKPMMEQVFNNACSPEFARAFSEQFSYIDYAAAKSEEDIFTQAGMAFIPACQRESATIFERVKKQPLPGLLDHSDVKGIIHSHSNWSDGSNSIAEMAASAIAKGYEYLVISDHSRTAFYANGLQVERVREQHLNIDELNAQLVPFRIFKSIESDILNDGSLDYPNEILATFDMVIASIHSNLKMSEEKAMKRLINAIENPLHHHLGTYDGAIAAEPQRLPGGPQEDH